MEFVALLVLDLFKGKSFVNRFKLIFWILYISMKLKPGF
ncbi:hypothetical protein EV13_1653 [Prochlorococcus sp. MIT 0702]|nr:hypothetical protein EV12_1582 [Prochlorococcus sp. MIT 0701]KGG28240.1 hypothetical protein EV13_1653 [Prochlorococcus sp. MIT 0702]KGG31455.1 hypothetical protein EV14_2247 [Prochlorococcus sp. MIT 0703]